MFLKHGIPSLSAEILKLPSFQIHAWLNIWTELAHHPQALIQTRFGHEGKLQVLIYTIRHSEGGWGGVPKGEEVLQGPEWGVY